jgi:hypothetical protein
VWLYSWKLSQTSTCGPIDSTWSSKKEEEEEDQNYKDKADKYSP